MKALAISLLAGAALCSVVSAPASAMPTSNLAAAASDLALGHSVRLSATITATERAAMGAITAMGPAVQTPLARLATRNAASRGKLKGGPRA